MPETGAKPANRGSTTRRVLLAAGGRHAQVNRRFFSRLAPPMKKLGAALAMLLVPGAIMAQQCPLSAPLTLKDMQAGIVGETGTVWVIAADCSYTIARQMGFTTGEPYKHGRLTAEQRGHLEEIVERLQRVRLAEHSAPAPRANARRISLSYAGNELALTLPPGGGELAGLRASAADPRSRGILDLAALLKGMLGS
jgi:hypothetical protein